MPCAARRHASTLRSRESLPMLGAIPDAGYKTDAPGRGADQFASQQFGPSPGVWRQSPAPPPQSTRQTPVEGYANCHLSSATHRTKKAEYFDDEATTERYRCRFIYPEATPSLPRLTTDPPRTANLSETQRPISRSLASKKQFRKSPASLRKTKATSRQAAPRNRRMAS